MTIGRPIRVGAYRWHCAVAHSATATHAYINAVAALARMAPSAWLRRTIEWAITGQEVPWRPVSFAARTVTVGDRTSIRLRPHLGEFDQAALFGRQLDYERPVFVWLERHAAQRYDAIIEIGANVGVYSVFFDALVQQNPDGRLKRIYAFEPSRAAYRRLLDNIEINQADSVEPFAVAIADRTGFVDFYQPEGHLTNGSLLPDFASLFATNVRRDAVVAMAGSYVAELFDRHQSVLVKIDAEGAEARILSSMAPAIERHHPDLLIEVLDGMDEQLQALDILKPYIRFNFAEGGLSRREALTADPSLRDWLLTASPADV